MNSSYEKFSFYNNFFGGSIEGDNILSTDFYGNKQMIGVTTKKYQDTLNLLNTYYDKLVELGAIQKEKTPEEIAKEQQEIMQAMYSQMQSLQEKIDNMQKEQNAIKESQNDGYKSDSKENNRKNEFGSSSASKTERINSKCKEFNEFNKKPNGSIQQSKC